MRRLGILGFAAWLLAAALPAQAQQVNLYCNTGSGLTAWQPASAANPCPVNATASISGFPGTQTTGTPISVTTGGVSGTLPSGTEVVATNVGTTNAAYCKLGASATTSDQYIAPNGGWFGFTVGSATQLTCITSTSTTTVNMVGGSGIPTGTGGGGGSSGGGGAVTIADGADVAQGTTTDAACATDNGTCTEVALIKRNNQRLTTLNTTLGSPFQAGGSIGNTTFAATQGTAANLNATVVGTGTFLVQAAQSGTWNIGTLTTLTGGGVASGATDSGNPIKVGGKYNSTPITLTDGQRGDLQLDASGFLKVNVAAPVVGLAQGSTTSGQTGSLVMAAVTTGAPTYTTAQTSPLSLSTTGDLRTAFSNTTIAVTNAGTFIAQSQPTPVTSGGLTNYFVQPAASDNHVVIKAGAGQVYKVSVTNNSATINYLRLYNATTGFNGCNSATNIVYQMAIPASTSGAGYSDSWDLGLAFATGISICVTSGYATTDTTNATASAMSVNVGYK